MRSVRITVFGFYTEKFSWHESKDSKYTSIPGAIINQKDAKPLKWMDYKVYIMLKDGTLFNSYTKISTAAVLWFLGSLCNQ